MSCILGPSTCSLRTPPVSSVFSPPCPAHVQEVRWTLLPKYAETELGSVLKLALCTLAPQKVYIFIDTIELLLCHKSSIAGFSHG